MAVSIISVAVWLVLLTQIQSIQCQDENTTRISTIRYEYDKEYTISIDNTTEYVFESKNTNLLNSKQPSRVFIQSNEANKIFPVFILARQQKGVISWQLPLVVDNVELNSLSRTLCPNHNFFNNGDESHFQKHPIVHIYTSSIKNISVSIKIFLVKDFYITSEQDKLVTASPINPGIYFYSFKEDFNEKEFLKDKKSDDSTSLKSVNVIINSPDEYCMLMSIQNVSCPIFDTENDIFYEGDYETISKKGAITVMEKHFPLGFYIVLLVKTNDKDCTGYSSNKTISPFSQFFDVGIQPYDHPDKPIFPMGNLNANLRQKVMTLRISENISQGTYWLATMLALAGILLVYIIFLIGMCIIKYKPMRIDEVDSPEAVASLQNNRNSHNESHQINSNAANTGSDENPSTAVSSERTCDTVDAGETTSTDGQNLRNSATINGSYVVINKPKPGEIYLDQLCTKDITFIKHQSSLYLWHIVTIAIFYALPVIQLVITYQRMLNKSGNHDLCYYNFLCAHPLGYLSDFNHVYSNIGYLLLGALFIFFVWRREKRHEDMTFEMYYGIPQHYGLFYAMGVSLMMEGVLSASYHVCPNHSNFQFDTSFMYIMAVLSMVTIYQTRHPDINARAHSTFIVLAISIMICMFGVLYPNFYFWLFFTILHVCACFVLTMRIYYFGYWKFSFLIPTNYNAREICSPTYRSRFILVLIANLSNIGLAAFGLYHHSKDFASHLLYIFLMNLALHLIFYITMKLTESEIPSVYTWLLIVVALITWSGSLYFFFSTSTSWALTAAESRTYNRPCMLLKFYDTHDIWHFLSALAMFFSFMLLLTLDDDITHKLRSNILVF